MPLARKSRTDDKAIIRKLYAASLLDSATEPRSPSCPNSKRRGSRKSNQKAPKANLLIIIKLEAESSKVRLESMMSRIETQLKPELPDGWCEAKLGIGPTPFFNEAATMFFVTLSGPLRSVRKTRDLVGSYMSFREKALDKDCVNDWKKEGKVVADYEVVVSRSPITWSSSCDYELAKINKA